MLLAALKSLHPRAQPWITRGTYRRDLVMSMTFPVAVAVMDNSVVGVLARKVFDVSPLLFSLIIAAQFFANLTSFAWAWASRGKPKVRFLTGIQVTFLLMVCAVAVLPINTLGAAALTLIVVVSRCLLAGMATIRSSIWRNNYPRAFRARVTSKLMIIAQLIFMIAPLAGYRLLDYEPRLFRLVYPLAAMVAVIGVVWFSRIRLRGEREQLRYEKTRGVKPQPHGETAPIYEYDRAADDNFWTVLRRDRFYREYQIWQFIIGLAGIGTEAVIIFIIADMTRGSANEFATSILLSTALPAALTLSTAPLWARLLDRMHIVDFRASQVWIWLLVGLFYWIGVGHHSLLLVGAGRFIQGCFRGGGLLAWQLGHNDFAERRLVAVYMGIHITLTGVRGATVPFVAMFAYAGWNGMTLPGLGIDLPGFAGIGHHVFLVTIALSIVAEIGFIRLGRAVRQSKQTPAV